MKLMIIKWYLNCLKGKKDHQVVPNFGHGNWIREGLNDTPEKLYERVTFSSFIIYIITNGFLLSLSDFSHPCCCVVSIQEEPETGKNSETCKRADE